jgi:hypothetical protein
MVNYVRAAANAKRLIEENGREVDLYRKSRTPADAAKPWRGPTSPGNTLVGSPIAFIYPATEKDEQGGLLRKGEMTCLIAHDSLDPAEDLTTLDHIVDGSDTWKVEQAWKIGPGTVTVLYQFKLTR